LTNVTVNGTLSGTQSNVTVTVSAPPGWVYLQFPDPSGGTMTIGQRATLRRRQPVAGTKCLADARARSHAAAAAAGLVHLFDYNSTGSYTITYGPAVTAPTVTTLAGVATNSVSATLNALVNPNNGATTVYFEWGTTTNYTGITPQLSLTQSLNTPQDAALLLEGLQPNTTYHYQAVAVNSAGTSFGGDVSFTTPLVTPPVITQVAYVSMAVGQNLVITNRANTQVTFSLDPVDPAGAAITTNGIFRWTPACNQGSSTNIITIWATDVQYPTVSNYMTFLVTVGDCVELSVGSAAPMPLPAERALRKLGRDLALARRKRGIATSDMAARLFVSRDTLWRLERGDPTVALGTLVTAAFILNLHDRLANLAAPASDELGLSLDERRLPQRIRRPNHELGSPY
jgi:transcriptional regulator with XRE-family HTH domain